MKSAGEFGCLKIVTDPSRIDFAWSGIQILIVTSLVYTLFCFVRIFFNIPKVEI